MELAQIEENLKGITKLVNKLYEEVEKMKQVEEEPCLYQLNVYAEKPRCYEEELGQMHKDNFYYVNSYGEPIRTFWENCNLDKALWENTILFKDRLSADTYIELMHDMKCLSKKFEFMEEQEIDEENENCQFVLTSEGFVVIYDDNNLQTRDYHFTLENAEYIINKYGQEVLKNFILYCK